MSVIDPSPFFPQHSAPNLGEELNRLARFGANVSDSFSCFIFLPSRVARPFAGESLELIDTGATECLHLVGAHSLCPDIVEHCAVACGTGLIGWVAKHHRSIHVSPFEHDSRTLGMYRTDQQLKSFIGVPILLEGSATDPSGGTHCGVIACDSKKSFAFSKLQGKLIEELASQAATLVRYAFAARAGGSFEYSYESFLDAGSVVAQSSGVAALGLLRIRPLNLPALEQALGSRGTIKLFDQVVRLVKQTLPPGTPLCKLPNGELMAAVDNMMLSFYESRIEAIAGHATENGHRMLFEYVQPGKKLRKVTAETFEDFVREQLAAANPAPTVAFALTAELPPSQEKARYEYRRA